MIYVARNPKVVIVSYYFHHKLFPSVQNFTADIESFAEYFMNDQGMLISPVNLEFKYFSVPNSHLNSYLFTLLSSRTGRVEEKRQSKLAVPLLRGHEKGFAQRN